MHERVVNLCIVRILDVLDPNRLMTTAIAAVNSQKNNGPNNEPCGFPNRSIGIADRLLSHLDDDDHQCRSEFSLVRSRFEIPTAAQVTSLARFSSAVSVAWPHLQTDSG
jgi:hypothetical protein